MQQQQQQQQFTIIKLVYAFYSYVNYHSSIIHFCVMVVVVLNLIQFIPTMMVENLLYTWINLVNLCRGLHIIIRQGY